MGSPSQRKPSVLTYLGTNSVPMLVVRDVWPEGLVAKDSFWVMADEMPLAVATPFERVDEDRHHIYQALFEDHPGGEGIMVDP